MNYVMIFEEVHNFELFTGRILSTAKVGQL